MGSDGFFTILTLLVVCCGPVIVVAILGGVVYISYFLPRKQLKSLADQLGWMLDTRYPKQYHGYTGAHLGRIADMIIGARHDSTAGPHGSRWSSALRVSLELKPKTFRRLDVYAWRHPKNYENFESVFRQNTNEPLSAEIQTAMLNFARKRQDLSIVSYPPAGNEPNPPPVTKMELQHTFRSMQANAADVREALDDMAALADVIDEAL